MKAPLLTLLKRDSNDSTVLCCDNTLIRACCHNSNTVAVALSCVTTGKCHIEKHHTTPTSEGNVP